MMLPEFGIPFTGVQGAPGKDITSREKTHPRAPLEQVNLEFSCMLPDQNNGGSRSDLFRCFLLGVHVHC